MPNTFSNANKLNMQGGKLSAKQILIIASVVIILFILTYGLIRFTIDQINYKKGHQAYSQSNCAAAIPYYDKILNRNRLIDPYDLTVLARQEKTECLNFMQADEKQQLQEFDAALFAYMAFINDYRGSGLLNVARNRILSLFGLTVPSDLASLETCPNIPFLLSENLIPQPEVNLPLLYMACGQVYDQAQMKQEAYSMHETFLTEYPDNPFAQKVETSLISNHIACENITTLKDNNVISNRLDFFPKLYQSCGQIYASINDLESASDMYTTLLTEYPQHPFAIESENYLLSSPLTCERIFQLEDNDSISVRVDFLPRLYYNCGQLHESEGNWAEAIELYEGFLASYPDHSLAKDVKARLAPLIVAQAASTSAGEIDPPVRSGSSGSVKAEVDIQNDSPHQIRIVFSGPENRIEELGACDACREYFATGPLYCPELGPVGKYTLQPGEYDIVVESISDEGVKPWTGTWGLGSGSSYYSCFFLVTTFVP